jgi:ABC-type iron transport system FetAB ATPase subunit
MDTIPFLRIDSLKYLDYSKISLNLYKNEIISISGESGAGKSLFLKAIIDLIPSSGDISIGNINRNSLPAHQWRKKIGLLATESFWWGDTIGGNIPEIKTERLNALNFKKDIYLKPFHILSTGEKQRLAFLRILENKPEVLLLDEPTASLDSENTAKFENLVLKIVKEQEVAMIIVSHNREQRLRLATRHFKFINQKLIPDSP